MENKVASKLVQMLVTKGVSKIIKQYGYLPVDYLKKNQTANAAMPAKGQSKKRAFK